MSIQCVFYEPNEACSCQVLTQARAGTLPSGVSEHLAGRYCGSGRFIGCPIYIRFQRTMDAAHKELAILASGPRKAGRNRAEQGRRERVAV